MAVTMPNPRAVPLVLPGGMLASAWVRPFEEVFGAGGAASGDVSALQTALAVALSRIAALEVLAASLAARVQDLEDAAGTGAGDAMLMQPAPALAGPQGERGEQGEPGVSTFPAPLTPIPLEWPEGLRSQLELSGLY